MKKYLRLLLFLCYSAIAFSQESFIAFYPKDVYEKANAVIKDYKLNLEITDYNKFKLNKYRVITVFNKQGLNCLDTYEFFSKSTVVRDVEITVFNALGKEIKKIRKKDFEENSVSQGSVITDNRVLYFDYVPTEYPFTIVYKSEIVSDNTAFLPSWMPISDYNMSLIHSEFEIKYNKELNLNYKILDPETKITDHSIKVEDEQELLRFSLDSVNAVQKERYAPSMYKVFPKVMIGLEEFELEGIKGTAKSWEEFGNWMYTYLLADTEEIPEETIQKIANLIKDEKDNLKKAKIIYNYVQNNTRYVSIQLGIGGWKPMKAAEVDKLGYGDCKALTNYTRSLLKAFDIPSYYTIVYGDRAKRDLVEDFVSVQGNHVILGIPDKENIIWLECTSQDIPFGFQGNFTDDRKVLIVDKDKSKIVRTKTYEAETNRQITTGSYKITESGTMTSKITIESSGLDYLVYRELYTAPERDKKDHYLNTYSYLKNLNIQSLNLINDKEAVLFKEEIAMESVNYVEKYGNDLIFHYNAFNRMQKNSRKDPDRLLPFEIERGYYEEDRIDILLPEGYTISELPSEISIHSEFGEYDLSFQLKSENTVSYIRKLTLKKGMYQNDRFDEYQKFIGKIIKGDNIKILINKK
ncbi:transglutaminase family protein [Flavobacterium sp. NRK F10]|uniref:transglutaminase-like domain-containing protein n=1 Tax=Flavobacterium sp. NRK F10 TaxID=2954931 RepID=UPI002090C406|nr:transglutaminase family protein [Flavobacterium sp. NRK F10]MCO6174372.1 transglutaminase family protein [Flavobacterium sp. NRK F10]